MRSKSNPQEEEHKVFAKEIVDYLEKHRQQNNYDRILLCAEPGFYGRLNKVIASPLEQIITKVVQKDYVPLPKPKLDNMIKKLIEEHY
ncbi:MAG: host attachment protein [Francisellaceae bacterium]